MYNLLNERLPVGEHQLRLSPPSLPAGLYLLQIKAGETVHYKKVLKVD